MKITGIKQPFKTGFRIALLFVAGIVLGMLPAKQVNAQGSTSSLLWKIEDNSLAKPSYLYGTIHLICPDDFFFTEATQKVLDEVEHIAMEIDLSDPQMMTKMQQLSLNPGRKNFSEDLTEEDAKVLNEFLQANYGADLTQLGVMKPFALYSMIIIKALKCDQPASYELAFVKEATKRELEISGLETPEFQMGLFDDIPQTEQIQWIVEAIVEKEDTQEEFTRMVAAYKEQDLKALSGIIMENDQFAGYADMLLYQRNKDWISKIEKLAKDGSTLIAVGAGHLGSDQGVIALLKKEGYTISPVP
ncbi:TraB/GumN family protein [Fulvivirga sp. M361]|uniref:TraB/GumN family protein n=1 Tax=Fulvivirga sp. M361 TaxID=2594266 RepID=UPI00117AA8F1|nr:TraB/GumN family protein [Fulvivirga sp. M361]TRX61433.1 TraB/GumN family protein [Fulvivirga sp. M361]